MTTYSTWTLDQLQAERAEIEAALQNRQTDLAHLESLAHELLNEEESKIHGYQAAAMRFRPLFVYLAHPKMTSKQQRRVNDARQAAVDHLAFEANTEDQRAAA